MARRILIVEDERAQRDPLARYLVRCGYAVDAVSSGEDGEAALAANRYAVLITDLRLPGIDGLELIRRASRDADLGVLLITAYASVESAVEALRIGAHDYLLKPLMLDDVGRKVANLIRLRELSRENVQLRRALHAQQRAPAVVAESAAMVEVARWIERAAGTRAPVLLVGEAGTGKGVIARAIHRASHDDDQAFLSLDVGSLPTGMIEGELFGFERGAFTGATKPRDGLLRAAGSGTVFIREVGDLPDGVQLALLHTLEAGTLKPLGSDTPVPFDARLIVGTRQDPVALVEARKIREDLLSRLNVLRISIPPLRDRVEDIPELVRHLLARHAGVERGASVEVAPDAMRALCSHGWPGNVRELRNVLERASMLADGAPIDAEHLPPEVAGTSGPRLALQEAIDRFERSYIAMVLKLCDGNRERAARELGISPATLYRRLDRHSLKNENPPSRDSQS